MDRLRNTLLPRTAAGIGAVARSAPDRTNARQRLFRKYVTLIVALVGGALIVSGVIGGYFSYREARSSVLALAREKAASAAYRIERFVTEIEHHLGWTVLPQVVAGASSLEPQQLELLKLLRQVPAITDASYIDGQGRERLRVSRLAMDVIGGGADLSADPRFTEARSGRTYVGPVHFKGGSEPYMAMAMRRRVDGGVTAVDVNLKFIWDVISHIRIGEAGFAYVVDAQGRLIAHPDISLVLRRTELSAVPHVKAALSGAAPATEDLRLIGETRDREGEPALTAHARIDALGWVVFVEQPLREAYAPLYAALGRSGVLLLAGLALSVLASLALARSMVRPIRALQEGAARIGAGRLDQQIEVRTGDELESLAGEFNRMAAQLRESYAGLERKVEDRTRDLQRSLEYQTATAEILRVISTSPTDLQPVFEAIVESASRLCESVDASLYRVEGDVMRHVASNGVPSTLRVGETRPITRGTVSGRTMIDRQPVHIPDLVAIASTEYPDIDPVVFQRGVRTTLGMPLLREGVALGSIVIRRLEARPFSDQQIALLQTFADQAAIAIENVRLFQALEARNRELTEALEQQTATADILRVISNSPTDLQPVLDAVGESAARLCEATNAVIFRVEDGVLRQVASYGGMPTASHPSAGLPLTRGRVTTRAVADRATIHVHDLAAEETDFPEGSADARRDGHRTTLATPLLREGVPVGAILIRRMEVRPFSGQQIKLLETFADQAVIAIENTRLFNELKARNRDLTEALEQQTATAEILRVISGSPTDVQPVFDAVARNAVILCGGLYANVFRFDGELLHWVATYGRPEGLQEAMAHKYPMRPDASQLSGRAILAGSVVCTEDTLSDPDYDHEIARSAARRMLGAPMLREGNPIGAIVVGWAEPGTIPKGQEELLKTFADQAAIAIENVRLFNELQARNRDVTEALEQQTATAEILKVISSSPTDVKPVFDAIVKSGVRLFQGVAVSLRLVKGDRIEHVAFAAGPGCEVTDDLMRSSFAFDDRSVVGRAVLRREVIQAPDVFAEDWVGEESRNVAERMGIRAIAAAPMLREGKALGTVSVNRAEAAPFREKELALLRTFADQAVIAIENVRLFNETKEALDQQKASAEVLQVISSSVADTKPVFDKILESCERLFEGRHVGINLVGEDGTVHLGPYRGPGRPELEGIYPLPLSRESGSGSAILERRVMHYPDVEGGADVPEPVRHGGRIMGYKSVIFAPMLWEGRGIGAIWVGRGAVGEFSEKEIGLLRTFADQAVIAIQNARLFNELQTRTRELARSVEELKALGEVGRAVSSTLDLENVLTTIVARALELAAADGGTISEYDETTQQFHFRTTYGVEDELVEVLRAAPIRLGEGTAGKAAAARAPFQVADILDEREYDVVRVREVWERFGYRSALSVPLLREDRILGALTVWRRQVGEFSSEVVNLLQTFATQSTLAIQHARLFRELEEKGRELELASRHKSEFLANMSHELRTPLNAVLGYTELISDDIYGEVPEKIREVIGRIDQSGRHLLGLINDVLDLSKIEAGQLTLSLADYSMKELVQTVLVAMESLAAEKKLALEVDVAADLPRGRGDERRLSQVLLNLVGNALKFTEAGEIRVAAALEDGQFRIAVADTGLGISRSDQERIFEAFQQVDSSLTRKKGGTGLGLSIARRIVQLHGGRLWVESAPGKGSTFSFTVPVRVEREVTT